MHRNNQIELTCWRAKIPLPFLDSVICINYRLSQQHQPQKTNIQRKREKSIFEETLITLVQRLTLGDGYMHETTRHKCKEQDRNTI